MNIKKFIASLITIVLSAILIGAPVSAEKYTYDLKTYDRVSSNATVTYTLEYGPSARGDSYFVKNPDGSLVLDFINSNVEDILAVSIETEQMTNGNGLLGSTAKQRYGYTKDTTIAQSSNFYFYCPEWFKGNSVVIPYGVANGFTLGNDIVTLGYSNMYQYGFSHIKIQLTCKINKTYVKEQAYGSIATQNFVNASGYDAVPNLSTFTYTDTLTLDYKVYPFKTALYAYPYETEEGYILYTNNVVFALKSPKYIDGIYYRNPIAHINDLIAKSDDVSFTFVSYYNNVQNIYNPYSYINLDLFQGSLIVNSEFTLQLRDTDSFSWQKDRLTFTWNSLTDGTVTNANTYLTSMNLYTSRDWYWDSLIVESIDAADVIEDVSAAAGFWDAYKEIA